MNIYKISDKIFILLWIIFIICCSKMAVADEKPIPVSPAEIKSLPSTQTETGPSTIITPSNKLNRNAIGCVLPLSGQYAVWGNKALDAILLSAGIFDKENKTSVDVIVEDSGGLPEKTKAAIAHLANDNNVIAIIAVTETAEAFEAAREANKWKVPIILITSREGVTSAGEYVFQHFLIPTQEIKALVQYAYDDLNCAIFSILYPQDDYGEQMEKIFREEVTNIGGKVEKAVPYNRKQTDFADEINKLTGLIVNSKVKANKNGNQEPASLSFEALFIPDSYSRVKMITSQLDFYDVRGFKLLGTSLWHSPELMKNSAEYLDGAIFADSFFVNGYYQETINFVDAYYAAYSREPESIEALSFDTAGMILSILKNKNVQTRPDLAVGLIKMENYNGATGNIYFDSNRVSQKTPFILIVKDKKFEQVR
jgi:ABC-type branched-subunit amino acid transport system substrate-binding protein